MLDRKLAEMKVVLKVALTVKQKDES